ncbi:hypothetical protein [Acidovorax sp.]|uniref:hypothetical protein n=1 Tax=Acidovorax sp. TaxID=1872122 RepID=UPI002ACD34A8|nr:hypothetical protein [Acidovorax sp.]MDZ7867341.1 hypothetical protein [Acidovorax sp.]
MRLPPMAGCVHGAQGEGGAPRYCRVPHPTRLDDAQGREDVVAYLATLRRLATADR